MKTNQFNRSILPSMAALNAALSPEMTGNPTHGREGAFNAALAVESSLSQPLTTYATGYRDTSGLEEALQFFAPEVPVAERFTYSTFDSDEEFESDTDDERAIGADFARTAYTQDEREGRTKNHGLMVIIDYDQVRGQDDWEERATRRLLYRLKRNALLRAVNMLGAAAVNQNLTWDNSAGKNPDQDVKRQLLQSKRESGIANNRVGFGDTAFQMRELSYEAQDTAGGFARSGKTIEQMAGLLGVDKTIVANSMLTTGLNTKENVLSNKVLLFNASDSADRDDPSNIKRFYSMGNEEEGGGRYQVYSYKLGPKQHVIAVSHYELIQMTSLLGLGQFTIS